MEGQCTTQKSEWPETQICPCLPPIAVFEGMLPEQIMFCELFWVFYFETVSLCSPGLCLPSAGISDGHQHPHQAGEWLFTPLWSPFFKVHSILLYHVGYFSPLYFYYLSTLFVLVAKKTCDATNKHKLITKAFPGVVLIMLSCHICLYKTIKTVVFP